MVVMMDNYNNNYNNSNRVYWKKKPKEENFNGGSRSRSQNNNKRSSFGNGLQQQSVLSLEKKFCATIGRVSWKKVLDTQKYMFQDEKVIHWKDSAVEEAFWNAKKRFWADILGHPCDIELPDPDVFIDKIDWESNVDTKLLLDLEKRDLDNPCEPDQKYSGVVVGIPVLPEQYVLAPMGWWDVEEEDPQPNNPERHDSVNNAEKGYSNNGWEDDYGHWGDSGVNNAEKGFSNNGWEHVYDHWGDNSVTNAKKGCSNGLAWNGYKNDNWWDHGDYNKQSYHGGRNTSRCKTSRYNHNGNDRSFTNDFGSNRRGNFPNIERPLIKWKPVARQW